MNPSSEDLHRRALIVVDAAVNEQSHQPLSNANTTTTTKTPATSSSVPSSSMMLATTIIMPQKQSNLPSLVVAILVTLTAGGANYGFGIYGSDLKHTLDLTQGELDTISSSVFVAGLFSWIPGLITDWLGTRRSMATGGVLNAVFMMLFWIVANQFEPINRTVMVPLLSALAFSSFLSTALTIGSAFKIAVSVTGPQIKGRVVGIAKAYLGLGAGTYTCIFQSIRQPGESTLDFLLVASFLALTCATLPALVLLPIDVPKHNELNEHATAKASTFYDGTSPMHFRILYGSLSVLIALIVGSSVLELLHSDDEGSVATPGLAILVIVAWIGPILSLLALPVSTELHNSNVVHNEGMDSSSIAHGTTVVDKQDEGTPLLDGHAAYDRANEAPNSGAILSISNSENDDVFKQLTLAEMLQTVPAYLLLWTLTILAGAGTVPINNMGQMVESRGFPASVTAAGLSLFSVAQAIARVATGVASDLVLHDHNLPRPVFLVVASLLTVLANLILAFLPSLPWFVMGVTLSGFAFGMIWPLMVLIVGEVFGAEHMAANYMFYDGFTLAAGTLLMTKLLSQYVYEHHIEQTDNDEHINTTCLGMGCFRATYVTVAILSLTCAVTGAVWSIARADYIQKLMSRLKQTLRADPELISYEGNKILFLHRCSFAASSNHVIETGHE